MARLDPAGELAAKMLEKLRQRRGDDEFPLTVRCLGVLADLNATPQLVAKALAKKAFAGQFLVAFKKDLESPVCLVEDADRLADNPILLRRVLDKACTAKRPKATLGQLQGRLPEPLRRPFACALDRHLAAGMIPEGIGHLPGSGGGEWYLTHLLPARALLAARMLRTLVQWQKEGANYPPTLRQLAAAADPAAEIELVMAAVADKAFKGQTAFALGKSVDGPLALAEDAGRLLDSLALLPAALAAARTSENQAVSPEAVKKKVARPLQAGFAERLQRDLDAGNLPIGVSCLFIKKKPLLFLLNDLRTGASNSEAVRKGDAPLEKLGASPKLDQRSDDVPRATPVDFAGLFEQAFAQLDRAGGGHNLVSLVALRQALAVDRPAFDAGLDKLRRDGRYLLSAAEGRHGITAEEQAAGLREDGALLLYVSRRLGMKIEDRRSKIED